MCRRHMLFIMMHLHMKPFPMRRKKAQQEKRSEAKRRKQAKDIGARGSQQHWLPSQSQGHDAGSQPIAKAAADAILGFVTASSLLPSAGLPPQVRRRIYFHDMNSL